MRLLPSFTYDLELYAKLRIASMSTRRCRHPDIRKFDGVRCCLACGEAVFDAPPPKSSIEETQSTPTPYEYATLNYRLGQEVRLCELLPGEPTDPLQCEIIHVNLEDHPDYEAVSYTWASEDGDASLSRSIRCGHNRYIPITANCAAVLCQLRRRGLRRRLWVDAVSINQSNVNERNHQVGLMDHVYSQARSVRICIEDQQVPPEWIDYRQTFRLLQNGSPAEIDVNTDLLFRSLVHLLSLRYFRRAWVIQEVALATTAYLLVNGDELLLTESVMDRVDLLAWRNSFQLPGVLRLRWKANQMRLTDIAACLRAGLDSECTDPRDKVFSVLSFVDLQFRSLIAVDYSLEVEPVYASAVLAVISTRRNLDILSYVGWNEAALAVDWRTSPALTMDQFKHFLAHEDAREPARSSSQLIRISEWGPVRSLKQFEGEEIGPWRANLEIRTVDELEVVPNLVHKDTITPVIFCRRPHNPTNILPRFQVRAHFIDRIQQTNAHITGSRDLFTRKPGTYLQGMESMDINLAHQQFPEYAWLLPCFQRTQCTTQPVKSDE